MNFKNFGPSIIEALESLSANKMRSGLTILGIVIGVGAVIAMLALGAGVQESITGEIASVGSNLLFVIPGNQSEEVRNAQPMTMSDLEAIQDPLQVPAVGKAVPVLRGSAEASYNGETFNTTVSGTTPDYETVRDATLTEGSYFTQDNLLGLASVAIIGPDVATNLFGRDYGVVGETIRINGQPFDVIGLLASKGGSQFGSEDNVILVPYSTAQARLIKRSTYNQVDVIYAQAVNNDSVQAASDQITELLRSRHRIQLGEPNDFSIFTQDSILSIANSITNTLIIFLGGVAGISLLVGGIGIMNIMLVSVTERTREIGLRKALGARKSDILTQFLLESGLLSMFGGILGIILGWLLSVLVGKIAAAAGTVINPSIQLDAILLATLFSAAVGIFFGIYPANRAANLEPVEALRYE